MATLAVRTKCAEMAVVTGVTSRASARRRNPVGSGPMAVVAIDPRVPAIQFKSRLLAMIKTPQIPSIRVVAALAGTSEILPVDIVDNVTTSAIDLRILESRIGVALLARDHGVQAK